MPLISVLVLLFNSTLLTSFKVSSTVIRPAGREREETERIVLPEHQLESMVLSRPSNAAATIQPVTQVAGKLQCRHTCSLDVFHLWKPIKSAQTAANGCKSYTWMQDFELCQDIAHRAVLI